mmetsp:Transcript_72754/g.205057  ORF Transcript_72754/g.205057 Transcript_72754/m.205057 type:complete len:120 (+) Transcript_72754:196-555(+)
MPSIIKYPLALLQPVSQGSIDEVVKLLFKVSLTQKGFGLSGMGHEHVNSLPFFVSTGFASPFEQFQEQPAAVCHDQGLAGSLVQIGGDSSTGFGLQLLESPKHLYGFRSPMPGAMPEPV